MASGAGPGGPGRVTRSGRCTCLPAADEYGPLMHVWGAVYDHDPATGELAREYLGIGRLVGHVQRERSYSYDVA